MLIPRVTRLGVAGVSAVLATCALGSAPELASAAAPAPAAHSAAAGHAAAASHPAARDAVRLSAAAAPQPRPQSRVVIRRTAHGVPHIEASGPYGLGLGYGYAFARDNICAIADDYTTVNAERSRWFGPDGISDRPAAASTNLASDLFWKQIIDSGTVERLIARRPPLGQSAMARQLVRGYAAGYNRYLERVGGADGITDPTCRGKGWVKPITAATVNRRLLQVSIVNSSEIAIQAIAGARPPGRAARTLRGVGPGARRELRPGTGSNAIAVGRAGTRDHRHGLLLGNPHLPWHGTERFYQAHLTIPGRLDVAGASLYGVPAIQIGHTRSMAWSHTDGTGLRLHRLPAGARQGLAHHVHGRRPPRADDEPARHRHRAPAPTAASRRSRGGCGPPDGARCWARPRVREPGVDAQERLRARGRGRDNVRASTPGSRSGARSRRPPPCARWSATGHPVERTRSWPTAAAARCSPTSASRRT